MKCLSVRQPWVFGIFHLGKDIENRSRWFSYRGPLAVHASLYHPRAQHEDVQDDFDASKRAVLEWAWHMVGLRGKHEDAA